MKIIGDVNGMSQARQNSTRVDSALSAWRRINATTASGGGDGPDVQTSHRRSARTVLQPPSSRHYHDYVPDPMASQPPASVLVIVSAMRPSAPGCGRVLESTRLLIAHS